MLNGECVRSEECPTDGWPILCEVNRTYQYRGIHVKTCDNVDLYPSDPGCYCAKGYLLDRSTGECVLKSDCPDGNLIQIEIDYISNLTYF